MLSRTSTSKGRKLNDLLNSDSDSDTIGTPLRSTPFSRPGTPTVREGNGSAPLTAVHAKRKRKIMDSDSDSDYDNGAGPTTVSEDLTDFGLAASTLRTPPAMITPHGQSSASAPAINSIIASSVTDESELSVHTVGSILKELGGGTVQPSVAKPRRGKTKMCFGDLLDRGSGQETAADDQNMNNNMSSSHISGDTAPSSSPPKTTASKFRTCSSNSAVLSAAEFPKNDGTLLTAFVDDWLEDGIVTSNDKLLTEKKKRTRKKESGEKKEKKEKKGKENKESIISSAGTIETESSAKLSFLFEPVEKQKPIPPRLPPLPAIEVKMPGIANTTTLIPEATESLKEINCTPTPSKSKRILPQSLLNNQSNILEVKSCQSHTVTEVTKKLLGGKEENLGPSILPKESVQSVMSNCKSFNTLEERMCAFNDFNEVKEYHLKKYKEGCNATTCDFNQKIKYSNLESVSTSNVKNSLLKGSFTDTEVEIIGDESAADAYFRCIKKTQNDFPVINIADENENNVKSDGIISDINNQSETIITPNIEVRNVLNLHKNIPADAEIFTIDDSDDDIDDSDYLDDDEEEEREFMLMYENTIRAGGR